MYHTYNEIFCLINLNYFQCSLDPLLATGVLICGTMASSILRRIFKLRFLRRQYKFVFYPNLDKSIYTAYVSCISYNAWQCGLFLFRNLFKSPKKMPKRSHIYDIPRFDDSDDDFTLKSPPSYEDSRFYRSQDRNFALQSCSSSKRGMFNGSSNLLNLLDILE